MRLKKEDVVVDTAQQHKEKNVWWGDYPAKNIHTRRKLTKSLGHYFSSWKEYMQTHYLPDGSPKTGYGFHGL